MSGSKKHKKKFRVVKRRIIFVAVLIICFVGVYLITNKTKESRRLMTTIDETNIDDGESVDNGTNESSVDEPAAPSNNADYEFDAEEVRNFLDKRLVKSDGKKIAFLTFDDGPSTTVTPKILKVLEENNVHATFFVVGQAVNKDTEEILKEELQQGHSIGNHTYSHNYDYLYPGGKVNANNFMTEVNKTNEILKNVLGADFHSRIVRMPGGHMSWPKGIDSLNAAFNENKYIYIDWNDYTQDAEGPKKNKEQLIEVLKKYYLGNDRLVVLMHDKAGKESTAEALPEVIKFLKDKGYEFKTLK